MQLQVQEVCALSGAVALVSGRHSEDALRDARNALKASGLRGTAARLAVFQHMLAARRPQSHSDVSAALHFHGFDAATIYRNLIELTRARILDRVDLGDHVWRFEKIRSVNRKQRTHPHFVCNDCGGVSCLEDGDVPLAGMRRTARIAEISAITVKGRCRSC